MGFHVPPGGQCCGRAPSLSPARFIFLGLLETPQVGYLVITPFTSMSVVGQGAGLLGELIAGHVDQEKANGIR